MRILQVRDGTEWRRWLEQHGTREKEIFLRYFKKASGKPRIAYEDAVSVALCFGWIDGQVRKYDSESFLQRFTPRRPNSRWSAINIRRARKQIRLGRMTAAGLAVFNPQKQVEAIPTELPPALQRLFERHQPAWRNFGLFPPSYRRMAVGWVASAKKEETALKRLQKLIDHSRQSRKIQFM